MNKLFLGFAFSVSSFVFLLHAARPQVPSRPEAAIDLPNTPSESAYLQPLSTSPVQDKAQEGPPPSVPSCDDFHKLLSQASEPAAPKEWSEWTGRAFSTWMESWHAVFRHPKHEVPANVLERMCFDQTENVLDAIFPKFVTLFPNTHLCDLQDVLCRPRDGVPRLDASSCDSLPGSSSLLITYTIMLSGHSFKSQVRVIVRKPDGLRLVKPLQADVEAVEPELALWRSGDVHERYGCSLCVNSDNRTVAHQIPFEPLGYGLWGFYPRKPQDLLECRRGVVRFTISYHTYGCTCPSTFEVAWEYDGKTIKPVEYRWGDSDPNSWRRFGETPIEELKKQISRRSTWGGK